MRYAIHEVAGHGPESKSTNKGPDGKTSVETRKSTTPGAQLSDETFATFREAQKAAKSFSPRVVTIVEISDEAAPAPEPKKK